MKKTSGSIFKPMKSLQANLKVSLKVILLFAALTLPAFMGLAPIKAQDTLRTFGPRFGVDLAPIAYYFADPPQTGLEFSLDMEVYHNLYPVFELGYSRMNTEYDTYTYLSGGPYARLGVDYDLLPNKDRSTHNSITAGFRYALSVFENGASDIVVEYPYWGDVSESDYSVLLNGHWIEMVLGMKAEVFSNFFIGWAFRYKILLTRNLDETMSPRFIPGFGNGMEDNSFGFSYSLFYKIPLLKR